MVLNHSRRDFMDNKIVMNICIGEPPDSSGFPGLALSLTSTLLSEEARGIFTLAYSDKSIPWPTNVNLTRYDVEWIRHFCNTILELSNDT